MPADVICTTHSYLGTGNPFHTLDVYKLDVRDGGGEAGDAGGLWVIFIHGGAWRDTNNTKRDGSHILTSLLKRSAAGSVPRFSGCASVDYRLSVPSADDGSIPRYPAHVQDVIAALSYLQHTQGFGGNYVLIGHSAGATLALQSLVPSLFLEKEKKRKRTLSEKEEHDAISAPRAVICTEGIYDLNSLVDEYPSYADFVANAFGRKGDRWKRASPSNLAIGKNYMGGRIVLVQSNEDELLSMRQTEEFQKVLDAGGAKTDVVIVSGTHDQVWKEDEVVDVVSEVVKEVESSLKKVNGQAAPKTSKRARL